MCAMWPQLAFVGIYGVMEERDDPEYVHNMIEWCGLDINYELSKTFSVRVDCVDESYTYRRLRFLHTAILLQRERIVEYLVSRPDLDVNIPDSDGNTPMLLAVEVRNKRIVQALLQHRSIDVNGQNGQRWFPLKYACFSLFWRECSECSCILDLLLSDSRTDVNQRGGYSGTTVLTDVASRSRTHPAHQSRIKDLFKILLDCPRIDVNMQDTNSYGETPLMDAFKRDDSEFVEMLLAHDHININQTNFHGETVLFYMSHWLRWDAEEWGLKGEAVPEDYHPEECDIGLDVIRLVLEDERLVMSHRDNQGRTIHDYLASGEFNHIFVDYEDARAAKAEQQVEALEQVFDFPEGLLESHVEPFLFMYT